ncbi:dihydroorotase [Acetobacteraceae bacterium ESL0709]|nr:dihydroorotase [Acetobacteraceae bacterium ESL0697]MDF7678257.1 dihydroorotase [Acetobacteraceae bacterium ESL0709]
MHYDLILRNGTCVFPWGEAKADIGVKDQHIASLNVTMQDEADQVIDATHLHILPGLIDSHVHLRDPGKPDVETIETGTRAAALGGIASVLDMPNTSPAVTDSAMLEWKRNHINDVASVDVGIYIGATRENTPHLARLEEEEGVCAIKVFAGSSTGNLMIEDDKGIEAVLRSGHRRVAFHAEDEYRLRERKCLFHKGQPYETHAQWRDAECAFRGTERVVTLAHKTGRPVHILHVSTAEEMEFLARHREVASVEVLANHLTQVGPECYERLGGLAVMNPPIRNEYHHKAIWAALLDGRVDVVSSDHAPHPLGAKKLPWMECPSGLTGVQTLVPLMLNHVNAGRLSLSHLVDVMAAGPARIYGIPNKGRLAVGFDADFTLVDLGKERTITNDWIASPVGWTPYDGTSVKGWPVATIVRGHIVMREDEIVSARQGKIISFLP